MSKTPEDHLAHGGDPQSEHAYHPAHLGHHWEDSQQQFEAGKLGMWLFLATEVLLFGGLFVAYAVWRGNNPELFGWSYQYLDRWLGATNTAVLILSSLTMALSVTYAQLNRKGAMLTCLILTFIGACIFMGIKYVEYQDKFREGIYPGLAFYEGPPNLEESKYWDPTLPVIGREELAAIQADETGEAMAELAETQQLQREAPAMAEVSAIQRAGTGPLGMRDEVDEPRAYPLHPLQDPNRPANAHMFFTIYFMMTGLHGIHVLIGMIVIGWLIARAAAGHFNSEYYTPVDLGGLYWHIVDLIWIFLFPLFYLI